MANNGSFSQYIYIYMSNRELCHSTSKPISDEEDTLKSFMAFDIKPHGLVFRVVVGSEIVVPQQSFLTMTLL